ncbi:MAG TPA: ABC transporter permease [Anaerolineales bacterium]|nr:ABC transporter permease [Anaerolineales bacterium]HMX18353.1 ABC transporter permease [Anaerolineales bacterium]HMX75719.1 ABC transporter permease [Anaerolineales bacterium]HMZ08456.1 ABC transporter permease [Anaerolineales bacterium]HNA90221.1 ABC transporter permease [Anaerolineales bacterium]
MLSRVSTYLYLRPKLVLALLLVPPLLWFLVIYIGSLISLLVNSFFSLDSFTGQIVREFTLKTYAKLFETSNLQIFARTTVMAALVTVACAALAFPLSYYMARFASPRMKTFLYIGVTLPLWSSYVVRVYSWKLILAQEGIVSWFAHIVRLDGLLDWYLSLPLVGGPSLAISSTGVFLVFVYIWLPYMVIPIQTALERVPKSLIEASSDLGAKPAQTFRNVILPLAFPGVIAGSIFTFSLTLGDFIVPQLFGSSAYTIGRAVLTFQGTSNNIPLAAAFTMGPILIMIVYLLIARKLGAFDAL